MAWLTHQLSTHLSQHTGASLLLSAPFPNIVVLDLNVLRLVMKHWVLGQLYTTLVITEDTSRF